MTTTKGVSDLAIVNALRTGKLRPSMVGLSQIEVRYYGNDNDIAESRKFRDDGCDLVSVLYNDAGRVGSFMHCSASYTDYPSDDIEGIGAEYATDGPPETVSYLSDDPALLARIAAIVNNEQEA